MVERGIGSQLKVDIDKGIWEPTVGHLLDADGIKEVLDAMDRNPFVRSFKDVFCDYTDPDLRFGIEEKLGISPRYERMIPLSVGIGGILKGSGQKEGAVAVLSLNPSAQRGYLKRGQTWEQWATRIQEVREKDNSEPRETHPKYSSVNVALMVASVGNDGTYQRKLKPDYLVAQLDRLLQNQLAFREPSYRMFATGKAYPRSGIVPLVTVLGSFKTSDYDGTKSPSRSHAVTTESINPYPGRKERIHNLGKDVIVPELQRRLAGDGFYVPPQVIDTKYRVVKQDPPRS